MWKFFRNNAGIIVKWNCFWHSLVFCSFSQEDLFKLYYVHVISVGFEHSVFRESLLASFLYVLNVWKIVVISLSDIVKICNSPEIPPAFTDKSTLQLSFKVMTIVVVMVMMMKILFLIKISSRTKYDLKPIQIWYSKVKWSVRKT